MHDDLALLIRSGNRLIAIETPDEDRAVASARAVAGTLGWPVHEWSITAGMDHPDGTLAIEADKPEKALAYVQVARGPALFVFKDLAPLAKEPFVHRLLRDLANDRRDFAVVLVDHQPLPDAVRRFVVPYALKYPDPDELEQVVRATFNRIRQSSYFEVKAEITRGEMEKVIQSLRGLGTSEVERAIASAILDDHVLNADDLPRIIEAKRTLLGSSGCLEAIAANMAPGELGGMDRLKAWLKKRRNGLTQKARDFGLDPPRGILLLGVQGCGKSLCARAVAAQWHMALLRLDPGVLYQKFVGETENRLRQALAQAEAMAPVVLWIDEIEKAFASAEGASADGGLSQRMFGTLLTWMQDHRAPIFLVATANNIAALPPELMRKGRFDEIFFVDLPNPKARERILAIHLARRKRKPESFDLARLASACDGFSGAEIEQAVIAALYSAFSDGVELNDRHILEEMAATRPLSVLMAERVRDLRAWARDRCIPAD